MDTVENDQFIWSLILFFFFTGVPEHAWNEFSQQLQHENRFSSSHRIVELIQKSKDEVAISISEGTKLFRARIMEENSQFESFLKSVYHNDSDFFSNKEMQQLFYSVFAYPDFFDEHNEMYERLKTEYSKWNSNQFKGFDASGSNMPPKEKATEGRVNPKGIPYLYLAEDPETSIYEVRPIIGQCVSVAEFVVRKELRIYDFTHFFTDRFSTEENTINDDHNLFNYICRQFSTPNYNEPLKYLPTQYLGEIIKNMGFDGLRFNSSLKKDGMNIVLFDNQFCEPVSSDFIKIERTELVFSNPEIYQIGDLISSVYKEKDEN